MSIWLKNEVERVAARVAALEAQDHGGTNALEGLLARIEKLEALAHTHNFGPKKNGKRDNGIVAPESVHGDETL